MSQNNEQRVSDREQSEMSPALNERILLQAVYWDEADFGAVAPDGVSELVDRDIGAAYNFVSGENKIGARVLIPTQHAEKPVPTVSRFRVHALHPQTRQGMEISHWGGEAPTEGLSVIFSSEITDAELAVTHFDLFPQPKPIETWDLDETITFIQSERENLGQPPLTQTEINLAISAQELFLKQIFDQHQRKNFLLAWKLKIISLTLKKEGSEEDSALYIKTRIEAYKPDSPESRAKSRGALKIVLKDGRTYLLYPSYKIPAHAELRQGQIPPATLEVVGPIEFNNGDVKPTESTKQYVFEVPYTEEVRNLEGEITKAAELIEQVID